MEKEYIQRNQEYKQFVTPMDSLFFPVRLHGRGDVGCGDDYASHLEFMLAPSRHVPDELRKELLFWQDDTSDRSDQSLQSVRTVLARISLVLPPGFSDQGCRLRFALCYARHLHRAEIRLALPQAIQTSFSMSVVPKQSLLNSNNEPTFQKGRPFDLRNQR